MQGWGCQGDKYWRFQSCCGAPHLPTVDSSSGQLCTRLLGTQWSALANNTPGDACSQNKSHRCHWAVLILQLSRSGLRYSAPWEMLHSCSKSQGSAGDYGVLVLPGLSSWQLHPCLLSTPEECLKKTWNQNVLLGDCFLSFVLQASWIAVSELSIIIRVEQWSLLLTSSFSELCCAGFIIISQG